jgi:hypothetical protein
MVSSLTVGNLEEIATEAKFYFKERRLKMRTSLALIAIAVVNKVFALTDFHLIVLCILLLFCIIFDIVDFTKTIVN